METQKNALIFLNHKEHKGHKVFLRTIFCLSITFRALPHDVSEQHSLCRPRESGDPEFYAIHPGINHPQSFLRGPRYYNIEPPSTQRAQSFS